MKKTDELTGLPAEWVVAALNYVLAAVPKKDNERLGRVCLAGEQLWGGDSFRTHVAHLLPGYRLRPVAWDRTSAAGLLAFLKGTIKASPTPVTVVLDGLLVTIRGATSTPIEWEAIAHPVLPEPGGPVLAVPASAPLLSTRARVDRDHDRAARTWPGINVACETRGTSDGPVRIDVWQADLLVATAVVSARRETSKERQETLPGVAPKVVEAPSVVSVAQPETTPPSSPEPAPVSWVQLAVLRGEWDAIPVDRDLGADFPLWRRQHDGLWVVWGPWPLGDAAIEATRTRIEALGLHVQTLPALDPHRQVPETHLLGPGETVAPEPAEVVIDAEAVVVVDEPAAQAAPEEGADASTPEPTKKVRRSRKASTKASGKASKPSRKTSTRRRGTTAESIVDGGL